MIINIIELINDQNNKIQIGTDKNDNPVYLGDIVYEDVEEWYSDDYWNGYDDKIRYIPPSEKRLCKGRIYRKVEFKRASFKLERVKTEGDLPMGSSATLSADQETLKNFIKFND